MTHDQKFYNTEIQKGGRKFHKEKNKKSMLMVIVKRQKRATHGEQLFFINLTY